MIFCALAIYTTRYAWGIREEPNRLLHEHGAFERVLGHADPAHVRFRLDYTFHVVKQYYPLL